MMKSTIFSTDQIRALEQQVFASGVRSDELMTRAGEAVFARIRATWPDARRLVVLCGSGNNGGDGYVIARLAHQAGYRVETYSSAPPRTADCELMLTRAREAGVAIKAWAGEPMDADVLVDALLGIGLNTPVTGILADLIQAINTSGVPVCAVDVPSGIDADTGALRGCAVQASLTVCLVGYKPGLLTGDGVGHAGQLALETLEIGAQFHPEPELARLLGREQAHFPRRTRNCHKGDFGHVLVIGGDQGMGGAVMMAAEAALRSGAGRVSVATHPDHVPALLARCPELMVHGVQHAAQVKALLDAATVVVIGMGLGRQAWGQRLWLTVQDTAKPLVADADALYWLAQQPQQRGQWVLTPHPGEAARLLATTNHQVQQDRLHAVRDLAARYGAITLLKGAGSLIADADQTRICPFGNAGMATAGMGDTLAGILGGLIAQFGLSLDIAAKAVLVHALAGDRAAVAGERGLIATDLLPHLRMLLNG